MSLSRNREQIRAKALSEETKFRQRLRGDSILITHSDLVADQWDYARNFWGPECFGPGSNEKVFWICRGTNNDSLHRFRRSIGARTAAWNKHSKFRGCPICAGTTPVQKREMLAVAHPELAKEWMAHENGCSANVVDACSGKLALWRCLQDKEHEYKSKVCARTASYQGCPQCFKGDKVDLTDFPQALRQFDRTAKNRGFSWRRLPADYSVFWKCPLRRKHQWYESFAELQSRDFECLHCHRQKAPKLADFPELLQQLHPTKNGSISHLAKLAAASRAELVWVCQNAHEWKATVYRRTRGEDANCPYCAWQQSSSDSNQHNSFHQHPTAVDLIAGKHWDAFWQGGSFSQHSNFNSKAGNQ